MPMIAQSASAAARLGGARRRPRGHRELGRAWGRRDRTDRRDPWKEITTMQPIGPPCSAAQRSGPAGGAGSLGYGINHHYIRRRRRGEGTHAGAAQAGVVEEWQGAVAPQRARAGVAGTEAQLPIAEADLPDRANDARSQDAARETLGASDVDNGRAVVAAPLGKRANDYDLDAAAGVAANAHHDRLRELAADARRQAQLFRDDAPSEPQDAAESRSTAAGPEEWNAATLGADAPPCKEGKHQSACFLL